MKTVVFSLGGSVINPGQISRSYLASFAALIDKNVNKYKFVIVCGGGALARQYIQACPDLGLTEGEKDQMGILATWMNAKLLQLYLKSHTGPNLPKSIDLLLEQFQKYPVVVCGGFLPAIKTDEDAAIIADLIGAGMIINITDVDGIYDKDPKKHKDAKRIDQMTYNEFFDQFKTMDIGAGSKMPFTLLATKVAERSNIPIIVCSKEIEVLNRVLAGESVGTTIKRT
ncbi:MAG: UMP kinase [Candidatus Hermodarchaeota archaeon]